MFPHHFAHTDLHMPTHVLEVMYELNLSLFSRPSNWHVLIMTCMPFMIYRMRDQNLSILLYNLFYYTILILQIS